MSINEKHASRRQSAMKASPVFLISNEGLPQCALNGAKASLTSTCFILANSARMDPKLLRYPILSSYLSAIIHGYREEQPGKWRTRM